MWEDVELEIKKLLELPIKSVEDLIYFWENVSEFTIIVSDVYGELYIKMTQFSDQPKYAKEFHRYIDEIVARCQPIEFQLKKKFCESLYFSQLPKEYIHLGNILKNDKDIFREENVAFLVEEEKLTAKYAEITSKMTVLFDGEEKTIQQLNGYLENKDRTIRECAWRAMYERYMRDQEQLDILFDNLKTIRIQIAKNAGFENYRDYVHKAKGRFSYSPGDLLQLHESVLQVVVPLVSEFDKERKEKLQLETVRPWDLKVSLEEEVDNPFHTHIELVEKSIRTIVKVDEGFGRELESMWKHNRIDAENRKGKAPGGYCYPLYEKGSSFIFMHSVGVRGDIETLMHEAGHAMHNMMKRDEKILEYREGPSEVAELASMSMELLSFKHREEFYKLKDLEGLYRDELKTKIQHLPWEIVIDAFQHWIYLNPERNADERRIYFSELMDRFNVGGDWTGLEKEKVVRWMMLLHIFEIPFYYIEYTLAQLGALAIWRNYKKDPKKTIEQYKNFMRLGYSQTVSEIYEAAGIRFDFSKEYIRELMNFVREELK